MARPENRNAYYDAIYDFNGVEIVKEVRKRFDVDASVLDVGGGWGKYRFLLHDYPAVDCVEIWEPNIHSCELHKVYRSVFGADIRSFEFDWYDLLIFGDVLEHMPYEDALVVIDYLWGRCEDALFSVPYMMPQDADENPYEKHEQTDLTLENMGTLYPMLERVSSTENGGIYRLRRADEWDGTSANRIIDIEDVYDVELPRITAFVASALGESWGSPG